MPYPLGIDHRAIVDRASIIAQEHLRVVRPDAPTDSDGREVSHPVISSEDEEMPPALSSTTSRTTTAPEEHPQLTTTPSTAVDATASQRVLSSCTTYGRMVSRRR